MIFVDSNVPMYVVGAPHAHRDRAASLLRTLVARRERLVTDAEVYQEILHRYRAIQRMSATDDAFAVLDRLVDEVFAVERRDVAAARSLLNDVRGLSARDALHIAVMQRYEVTHVMTFDRGFDQVDDIEVLR